MNEPLIFLSILPVILFVLIPFENINRWVRWLPVLVGGAVIVHSALWRGDAPHWWGPLAAFLMVIISDLAEKRRFRVPTSLGAIFIGQALVVENVGIVALCVCFADVFFNLHLFLQPPTEKKNEAVQNIFKSLLTLTPIFIAVLLKGEGNLVIFCVCVTICLRLFSWPLFRWQTDEKLQNNLNSLLAGPVAAFAFWHVLNFSINVEWSMIWLCLAAVFSLGASYREVAFALTLGAYCVSPAIGSAATGIWILSLNRGFSRYLVLLISALSGAVIVETASKILGENAAYALSGVTAIAASRPFVHMKAEKRPWYLDLGDALLGVGFIVLMIFVVEPVQLELGTQAAAFAIEFLVSFLIWRFLFSNKTKIWNPLSQFDFEEKLSQAKGLLAFSENPGKSLTIRELKPVTFFFAWVDSEAHLVWVLGILGAILLWGLR